MYLERLHVLNYRCFEEVIVELPATGISLITGRNNAGKSALLKSLDEVFGKGTTLAGRDGRTSWSVEATLALSPSDIRVLLNGASAERPSADDRVTFTLLVNGTESSRITGRSISTPYHDRANLNGFALNGVSKEMMNERVDELIKGFRDRYFHFDPIRSGSRANQPPRASSKLNGNGENLAQALLYLLSRKSPVADDVQRLLEQIVPDAGVLTAPAGEDDLTVAFRGPGGRLLSIKDLGTGVEQLVMTALVGFQHADGALLLLEEPEAHLHAGAQRQLAEQLNEWAESHQILVATHSPIFVDARRPDRSQVLLVEKDGTKSTVRPAEQNLPDVLRALGVRLSDVLSAEHVIVVEGPSDEAVLREWFGDLLLKRRVTIVPAAGGDLSFQADKLGDWLKDLTKLDRRFLFIRDRDELTDRNIKRLQDKGVHVLARRELENYLCEPAALKSYLDLDLTEDVIEKRLRKIADGLRPRVVMKRLVARLRDKQWMERRDADDLIKKNADAAAVTNFYRERLEALTDHVDRTEELMNEIEADVAARWDAEWSALAPGEELLRTFIHTHRPGSGYSKTSDAAPLAAHLAEPPAELRVLLEERLAEHAEA
ncbi:MAG: hypothetical protein SangKO_071540 [Sandaracinaceae bacterium]